MAKAGFWMRGARGKLAGASFGKGADGKTIQREIVTPKNPNTSPQLIQRAIMATIMRAYSAGKIVFDHSYEGISVGSKCQQKFMSDNLKALRGAVIADNNSTEAYSDLTARVVARGSVIPVANKYKISEGTLRNTVVLNGTYGCQFNFDGVTEAGLTVSGWCQKYGIVADDIFTFCAFLNKPSTNNNSTTGFDSLLDYQGTFDYVRLRVKPEALTSNILISQATFNDVFYNDDYSVHGIDEESLISSGVDVSTWRGGFTAGSAACIRSRENSKLRSSETMRVFNMGSVDFGIKTPSILPFWRKGSNTLGNSGLLLEGGGSGSSETDHLRDLSEGLYFFNFHNHRVAAIYGAVGENNRFNLPADERVIMLWTYVNNGIAYGVASDIVQQKSLQFKTSGRSATPTPSQLLNDILTQEHAGFSGRVLVDPFSDASDIEFLQKASIIPQYIEVTGHTGSYKVIVARNTDVDGTFSAGIYNIQDIARDDIGSPGEDFWWLLHNGEGSNIFAINKDNGEIRLLVDYNGKCYKVENGAAALSDTLPEAVANGEVNTIRCAYVNLNNKTWLQIEGDSYRYPTTLLTDYKNVSLADAFLLQIDGVFPIKYSGIYYYVVCISGQYYLVTKSGTQDAYGTAKPVCLDFRSSTEAPINYRSANQQGCGVFTGEELITDNTGVSQLIEAIADDYGILPSSTKFINLWDDSSSVTQFPFVSLMELEDGLYIMSYEGGWVNMLCVYATNYRYDTPRKELVPIWWNGSNPSTCDCYDSSVELLLDDIADAERASDILSSYLSGHLKYIDSLGVDEVWATFMEEHEEEGFTVQFEGYKPVLFVPHLVNLPHNTQNWYNVTLDINTGLRLPTLLPQLSEGWYRAHFTGPNGDSYFPLAVNGGRVSTSDNYDAALFTNFDGIDMYGVPDSGDITLHFNNAPDIGIEDFDNSQLPSEAIKLLINDSIGLPEDDGSLPVEQYPAGTYPPSLIDGGERILYIGGYWPLKIIIGSEEFGSLNTPVTLEGNINTSF